MTFDSIELWLFLCGLGLFLYGMQQLEVGLKLVGRNALQRGLRRSTGHPLGSVITGVVATAVLQSSSLVGLMVLAFVGAGLLEMRNAVGVIIGSNLGTTLTGWLVATLGFKLNLGEFALPIVAIGSLGAVMLERRPQLWGSAVLLLGLGFLLLGLGFMKDSVEAFSLSLDLSALAGAHPYWFFITGFVFAAIIQSSSATMMITLSALNAGIIELPAAAAIAIGADLGTTSTLLLGSIRGNAASKQVALAHFIYNLITNLLALFVLLPFIRPGLAFVGIVDPLYGLVAFHSFFNLVGIVTFLPFIDAFARFLERRFAHLTTGKAHFLPRTPAAVPEAALVALETETRTLLAMVVALNRRCFKLDGSAPAAQWRDWFGARTATYTEAYETVKQIEGEILDYARDLTAASPQAQVAARVEQLLMAVREGVYAAKGIKDIRANLVEFRHLAAPKVADYLARIGDHLRPFFAGIERALSAAPQVAPEQIDELAAADLTFNRNLTASFYREEGGAELTDLQTSTFLNVLREVQSANAALIRAVTMIRAEHR